MRIIAGRWKGCRLKSPKGRAVRPTADRVKEAWMSSLGTEIRKARVLDLFAGSGALGLEALSRGAKGVVFVESSPISLKTLKANIDLLEAWEEVTIVREDAMTYIEQLGIEDFDVALADPPYSRGYTEELVKAFRRHAFASKLWIEHARGEIDQSHVDYEQRQYGETVISIVEAGR